MKASAVLTKTFVNATAAGLDSDIATFVATLLEAQYIDLKFAGVSGAFTALLIYTK